MRIAQVSKALVLSLWLAAAAGGCGVIEVVMTSAPDSARAGDPVAFDLKITNRSQCPSLPPEVVLEAFIPLQSIFAGLNSELPPNAPPELIDFFNELKMFFEEVCAGGNPTPPMAPIATTACRRGDGEMVCTATGPAPAHEGENTSMTFATLGNRVRCELDAGTMRCELHLPLANGTAPAAGGAAALLVTQSLDCITGPEFVDQNAPVAVCAVGSINNPQGLAPGEMATGQVTLRAQGAGNLRNLVFIANNSDGVCKGGANAGQACESGGCPGSSCGEGICKGGSNDGKGCDVPNAATDCPGVSATCVACDTTTGAAFLSFDCTSTYVSPEPAPTMSPWGLASMAVGLLVAGSLWLRRGQGRRA